MLRVKRSDLIVDVIPKLSFLSVVIYVRNRILHLVVFGQVSYLVSSLLVLDIVEARVILTKAISRLLEYLSYRV